MEKKDKILLRRTIAGALIGGTLVTAGLGIAKFIEEGNFSIYKNSESLIAYHEFSEVTITPEGTKKSIEYITSDDSRSKIDNNLNCFVFKKPVSAEDGNISIENETYYISNLEDEEAATLIESLDLSNLKDVKILKQLLVKMGAYRSEKFNIVNRPEEYLEDYYDCNHTYNVSYTSYKNNYDKIRQETISRKELEDYNSHVNSLIAFGSVVGAFGSSAYYLSKQIMPKRRRGR